MDLPFEWLAVSVGGTVNGNTFEITRVAIARVLIVYNENVYHPVTWQWVTNIIW